MQNNIVGANNSSQVNKQQTSNILNSTGPIKIQNRLGDAQPAQVTDGKATLNNTINFGREGAGRPEKTKAMGKFNESINISEASIQEGG